MTEVIIPILNEQFLDALFNKAKRGGVQYLYTLLRVGGVGTYSKDPFFEVSEKMQTFHREIDSKNKEEILQALKEYFFNLEINSLLKNLLCCAEEGFYKYYPFETDFDTSRSSDYEEKKKFIREILASKQIPNYEDFLVNIYIPFIDKPESDLQSESEPELKTIAKTLFRFLHDFIEKYKKVLADFDEPEVFNSGKFTTVECLGGAEGLYRINFYHSNGSTSFYERTKTGTSGLNIMSGLPPDNHVVLFSGIEPLKSIWMYKDKPLYEHGVKGRYNIIGEYKPLIYPGDSMIISRVAHELTKDISDKTIYGCIFYMMATCHHAIEFIVKADFQIPDDYISFSSENIGTVILSKIEVKDSSNSEISNMCCYDCTLQLKEFSVEAVIRGLDLIDRALHRIAFRLDSKIDWFLKYPYVGDGDSGKINLSKENMNLLEDFMIDKTKGEDSEIFDVAISWYINGKNSKNLFTEFLSYCIAIESLLDPFLNKELGASKKFDIPEELSQEKILTYIHTKHTELYDKDPIDFVRESYFNGIQGISRRLRSAMTLIFGENHPYIDIFFKKNKDVSMYGLRSKLAHGSYTILDSEHREQVLENIGKIQAITYDFIVRLIYELLPTEEVVDINPSRSVTIVMGSNPRSCAVASTLDMFENKDWKIKADWIL